MEFSQRKSFLAAKEYIMPEDLKGISLINTSRSETQNEFKKWMGSSYDQLHFAAISELTTTASILVSNNIGHAVVVEGFN